MKTIQNMFNNLINKRNIALKDQLFMTRWVIFWDNQFMSNKHLSLKILQYTCIN